MSVLIYSVNRPVFLTQTTLDTQSDGMDDAELQFFNKIGGAFNSAKEWYGRQSTPVKIGLAVGGIVATPVVVGYTQNLVGGVVSGIAAPAVLGPLAPIAAGSGGAIALTTTTSAIAGTGAATSTGLVVTAVGGAAVGLAGGTILARTTK